MGGKGQAFAKGGCGCLLVFAVLALLAVVTGGRVHIDLCGAACLFVTGGLVGLVVMAIYNKGQRDANPPPDVRKLPTSGPAEPGAAPDRGKGRHTPTGEAASAAGERSVGHADGSEASDDLPMVDRIRANAELVVSVAANQLGEAVGFDEAGVRWLDEYIQRQHELGDPANRDGLVSTLGAFLGECIVHTFGGAWAEVDGAWCVRFDDRNAAYPFTKVNKHLEHGAGDSVLSFFTAIPVVFRR